MAGNQFKDYTPVVGRKESKRWVPAGASYDGDGWGDEYDDGLDTVKEESAEAESPPLHDASSGQTETEAEPVKAAVVVETPARLSESPAPEPAAEPEIPPATVDKEATPSSQTSGEKSTPPLQPPSAQTSRTTSRAKRQSTVTRRPLPADSEIKEDVALGPTAESFGAGYADAPAADSSASSDDDSDADSARPPSQSYEDIYEYYGNRESHPYSQLTRESVYYSTDSVVKSKSPSPGPGTALDSRSELEPISEAKSPESQHASDSEADESIDKTVIESDNEESAASPPTPEEQTRLEHEIMHTFMTSEKRKSPEVGAQLSPTHSRSTSSTSRSSMIGETFDAEIAELYQGTTAFLDRPISVYQNVQPLQTRSEEDLNDTSELATPTVASKSVFETTPGLPVESLEKGIDSLKIDAEPSGVPQLNFIAASPTAEDGERPRWQPLDAAADVPANTSSSTVTAATAAQTLDDSDDEAVEGSLVKDLSITAPMLEGVEQGVDTSGEVEKTTTRETVSSFEPHHAANDSATSALSMISDNHSVVPPDLPLPMAHEEAREGSPNPAQQFSQISAKVKRPPAVDFGALLSGPTSEARLAQLVNLRQREAEYESGLSVWLLATYSLLEGNSEVYTTGYPPENEGRSVSMTRQMTHISSEHLSSTKEALEHFGEKSTKKARSLFAKGRRLVKS